MWHYRDVNAAVNIRDYGEWPGAAGLQPVEFGVRPVQPAADGEAGTVMLVQSAITVPSADLDQITDSGF